MIPLLRQFVAPALCAAALPSQSEFEVRLEPRERVVAAGHDLELTLVIDVQRDAEVPAVLLSGMQLDIAIGGQWSARLEQDVNGTVKLTAGTKIQRLLTVPADRVAVPLAADLTDVTMAWHGIPTATAVVKLAPDTSNIAIDDLDLTKSTVLLLTSHGKMVIRFFPDKAPNHVKNFIKLAMSRFYDGTKFHRVIKGFMIQGGDPTTKDGATGRERLDTMLKLEPSDVKHQRGIVSMARTPHPDSASSQFFICHGAAPQLDHVPGDPSRPGYSAFGTLDAGFDTLDRIVDVQVRPNAQGEPASPIEPVHLHAAILLPVLKKK